MSLALTTKDSKALSADATAVSSSAFTPAASSLVIALLLNSKGTTPDAATLSSPSWLSGSWNACGDVTHVSVGMRAQAFWGYASSSTSSDLVAATFGGNTQTGFRMICVEVTGASAASGVFQFKTGQASNVTAATGALDNALQAATSVVLGFFGINTNAGIGQGDGESELSDAGHASPGRAGVAQYKVNDTSSVATFVSSSVVWIELEIVEATSGSALTLSLDDTVTLSDAATKGVGKPLADTVTPSDAVSKGIGKPVADTVTTTDDLSKGVGKATADTVALQDAVSSPSFPVSGDAARQRTLRGAGR